MVLYHTVGSWRRKGGGRHSSTMGTLGALETRFLPFSWFSVVKVDASLAQKHTQTRDTLSFTCVVCCLLVGDHEQQNDSFGQKQKP